MDRVKVALDILRNGEIPLKNVVEEILKEEGGLESLFDLSTACIVHISNMAKESDIKYCALELAAHIFNVLYGKMSNEQSQIDILSGILIHIMLNNNDGFPIEVKEEEIPSCGILIQKKDGVLKVALEQLEHKYRGSVC